MTGSPASDPSETPASADAEGSGARTRWGAVGVATVLALLAAALFSFLVMPHDPAPPPLATPGHTRPTGYHLVVRSLHIDAPIVSIAMSPARVLTPPSNPREVGWWNASARPGSTGGQTIIAGHTVHTGGGQFDHLGTITKGARIEIIRDRKTERYVATKVFTLSKKDVSDQAQQLFGQKRPANRLVLITCGDWTGTEYLTNVFVYAKPLGPRGSAGAAV